MEDRRPASADLGHWADPPVDAPAEERATPMPAEQRFLTLADVADILNTSVSQVYALVRSNELRAIKIGGRGQWRVERDQLEDYIKRMYEQTSEYIAEHPFVEADDSSD